MGKKNFKNPTKIQERKGLDALIQTQEPSNDISVSNSTQIDAKYTNYNVRVRQDFKEKIYVIKGRTGKSFTEIFDEIFESYFQS